MTIDTNELRRLAQAATPGPWKTGQYLGSLRQFVIHTDVGDKGRGSDVAFTSIAFGSDETVANARLIAAANPSAISELLDRLEATEEERDGLHHCFNEWIDKTEWVQRGINKGTISPKYLGLHRADVIASLLGAAEKERDALRAELDALKTQEPVAWRTFDGEGGYDYWSYEDNENYKLWWNARNPNHIGWVEPLYLAPGAKGE